MSVEQNVADLDQQCGAVSLGLLEAREAFRLRVPPIEIPQRVENGIASSPAEQLVQDSIFFCMRLLI